MTNRFREVTVAASVAAVLSFALPLQTFLGNAAIFPFSFARLLPELIGLFAVFTGGILLIGWLLDKFEGILLRWLPSLHLHLHHHLHLHLFSNFFLSLLTGAVLCVYLEAGILSLGIPELNGGAVPALANRLRGAVDAGVWGVLIVGFVVFARRLRLILHWVALGVLVLSLAALTDAVKGERRETRDASVEEGARHETRDASGRRETLDPLSSPVSRLMPSYESQPTVVANVKYSPSRNILVFILDSMPGLSMHEAIRGNRDLLAKFPGFTAYPQNAGMHECTKRGVPGLVTGHYYDPAEMSEADYPMTMYATNSFVRVAEAAGWSVAFSPDLLPYGFTNLPIETRVARVEKRRSRDRLAFLRQSTEVPYLSLFDTVAFRLSPFLLKAPLLYSRIRHAVKGRHSSDDFWGEASLYPLLAARPVAADGRPFLGVFHSWGVHPPWEGGFAAVATDKLARLGALMDAFRAAGLYDKSLIIVTSDHGLDGAKPLAGYPPSASALLWVKPEGATAPFAESTLETSHARIAPLVKAALARPLTADDCAQLLRAARRLYRAEVREGGHDSFKDWIRD